MRQLTVLKIFCIAYTAMLLSACINTDSSSNNTSHTTVNNVDSLKPVIPVAYDTSIFPVLFEKAFNEKAVIKEGNYAYTLRAFEIGKIKIESGKIIACDPIVMRDCAAFARQFPVGDFPVHIVMAKTTNDERVAFSRIAFSNNPVAKWEVALLPGQKPISLTDTSFYCYGVDGGTGLFIDSVANNEFALKGSSVWEDAFITRIEKSGYKGLVYHFGKHNLATFTSGYGDGCYATYIGFDSQGNVCRLLTDFAIFTWWK